MAMSETWEQHVGHGEVGCELASEGVVLRVEGSSVCVRLQRASACGGCHARGMCGASSFHSRGRVTELKVPIVAGHRRYAVGDRVRVTMDRDVGYRAIFYAYVVPFLLMMMGVGLGVFFGFSDLILFLTALLMVGLYFLALHAFGSRLLSQVRYRIAPLSGGEGDRVEEKGL